MKKISLAFLAVLFVSCDREERIVPTFTVSDWGECKDINVTYSNVPLHTDKLTTICNGLKGDQGDSCSVVDKVFGATITCGKSSVDIFHGKDGTSCHTQQLYNGSQITCDDGSYSFIMKGSQGIQGERGLTGHTGASGKNAIQCETFNTEGGVNLVCGETNTFIANGANGHSPKCVVSKSGSTSTLSCDGSEVKILDGKSSKCSVSKTGSVATLECDGESVKINDGQSIVGPKGEKGDSGAQGEQGKNAVQCVTKAIAGGAEIVCGDTTSIVWDGKDGKPSTCSVSKSGSTSTLTCDGSSIEIKDGAKGAKGSKGNTGADGKDGANGKDGVDGKDGTQISIIKLGTSSSMPEVALKIGEQCIAVYHQGALNDPYNVRLADVSGLNGIASDGSGTPIKNPCK